MPTQTFFGEFHNRTMTSLISPMPLLRALAPDERQLGGFILPPFQRPQVWTTEQQVRLIESLYRGMPVPALVWNQSENVAEVDGWLLDGQQRMNAILGYVHGRFPVDGWLYPDLPDIEHRHFERMHVAIIETRLDSLEACLDIYDRLAYGGTPHESMPHSEPMQGGGFHP